MCNGTCSKETGGRLGVVGAEEVIEGSEDNNDWGDGGVTIRRSGGGVTAIEKLGEEV